MWSPRSPLGSRLLSCPPRRATKRSGVASISRGRSIGRDAQNAGSNRREVGHALAKYQSVYVWHLCPLPDVDGDGQDEMFFYRDDGLFRYYDIRPNGTLGSPILQGDGYTSGWSSITAVDLDGNTPPPPPTTTTTTKPIPPNPGDSKNCSDFATWSQAQAWFNTYYPHYGDVARLDQDNDLIACEGLPGAP